MVSGGKEVWSSMFVNVRVCELVYHTHGLLLYWPCLVPLVKHVCPDQWAFILWK